MNLELALGLSCSNTSCLAVDSVHGYVAYPASGVMVIYDPKTNKQLHYLHVVRNAFSCADFSLDGRWLATGEVGCRPAIRVWAVKDGTEAAALGHHDFGTKSIMFNPAGTLIVSLGSEHDNVINVWSWPSKHRVCTNKLKDMIHAMSFSECGHYLVTAGVRHIKFWYPNFTLQSERSSNIILPKESAPPAPPFPLFGPSSVQPLYGRPGILKELKNNVFIDVCCGNGKSAKFVYVITKSGSIVMLNGKARVVYNEKMLPDYKITCLAVRCQVMFLGFCTGQIHVFNAITLDHMATLPPPTTFNEPRMDHGRVFSLAYDHTHRLLSAVYMNVCFCIWSLPEDGKAIKQKYLALYHRGGITDMQLLGGGGRAALVTVARDLTARLWGLSLADQVACNGLKVLVVDGVARVGPPGEEGDRPHAAAASVNGPQPRAPQSFCNFSPPRFNPWESNEATELNTSVTAVSTCRVKGQTECDIVTGDKLGNICVFRNKTFQHVLTVMAHNREITCLTSISDSQGFNTLVSGSRDRLIHIMDVNNKYLLVRTLDLHSATVTALMLYELNRSLYLLSSAADRIVYQASLTWKDGEAAPCTVDLANQFISSSSANDIQVEPRRGEVVLGCQDGAIRVLENNMQLRREYKGCIGEECQVTRIAVDSNRNLLLAAATDKTINVLHYVTGDVLASLSAHHKAVTGLAFVPDSDCVISAGMDGCVFLWRLEERLKNLGQRRGSPERLKDRVGVGKLQLGSPTRVTSCNARFHFSQATEASDARARAANDKSASSPPKRLSSHAHTAPAAPAAHGPASKGKELRTRVKQSQSASPKRKSCKTKRSYINMLRRDIDKIRSKLSSSRSSPEKKAVAGVGSSAPECNTSSLQQDVTDGVISQMISKGIDGGLAATVLDSISSPLKTHETGDSVEEIENTSRSRAGWNIAAHNAAEDLCSGIRSPTTIQLDCEQHTSGLKELRLALDAVGFKSPPESLSSHSENVSATRLSIPTPSTCSQEGFGDGASVLNDIENPLRGHEYFQLEDGMDGDCLRAISSAQREDSPTQPQASSYQEETEDDVLLVHEENYDKSISEELQHCDKDWRDC